MYAIRSYYAGPFGQLFRQLPEDSGIDADPLLFHPEQDRQQRHVDLAEDARESCLRELPLEDLPDSNDILRKSRRVAPFLPRPLAPRQEPLTQFGQVRRALLRCEEVCGDLQSYNFV